MSLVLLFTLVSATVHTSCSSPASASSTNRPPYMPSWIPPLSSSHSDRRISKDGGYSPLLSKLSTYSNRPRNPARELEKLRTGAVNHTIPAGMLKRAVSRTSSLESIMSQLRFQTPLNPALKYTHTDMSVHTPADAHTHTDTHTPVCDDDVLRVMSVADGPSEDHPIYGRWRLSFLSLRALGLPFYVPIPITVRISRSSAMHMNVRLKALGVEVPLGLYTVLKNTTRVVTVPLSDDDTHTHAHTHTDVLYGMKLEGNDERSERLGRPQRAFDLVVHQMESPSDPPLLAVRSDDAKDLMLLTRVCEDTEIHTHTHTHTHTPTLQDLRLRGGAGGSGVGVGVNGRHGGGGVSVLHRAAAAVDAWLGYVDVENNPELVDTIAMALAVVVVGFLFGGAVDDAAMHAVQAE